MAEDNSATDKMAKSLEQVVSILQQTYDDRKAIAIALSGQDWQEQQEGHSRRMEELKKEGEQAKAETLEFRAAILKTMEAQLDVLKRIEASVQKSS
jgi:hypothetical protein